MLFDSKSPPFLNEISPEESFKIAHAKRFIERYAGDAVFRSRLLQDARGTAIAYGLKMDPEEIRPLWDANFSRRCAEERRPVGQTVELCLRYDRAMVAWMTRRRNSESIAHPQYRAWWERQLARNDSEIGVPFNSKDVHAPVCFELSKGCTVGCWFCAISAERFGGAFAHTAENVRLWRETLEVVRDIVGPAAEVGFCYWATDPFDNPDYEDFIKEFHGVMGNLPATTTAMPHKDIARTRALIRMPEQYGFTYNRFSILTPKILDRIHQEFSAEELLWTGLELLNKESTAKKATAGRALEKLRKLRSEGEDAREWEEELTQGTIACVTGFLFNMVERSVKLISPCRADERWPKGYRVYQEGTFHSGAELRELMNAMMASNMPPSLRDHDRVALRRDLRYRELPDGFELSSAFTSQNITHPGYGRMLGGLVQSGAHTAQDIVGKLAQAGVDPKEARVSLNILFSRGFLDDEPVPSGTAVIRVTERALGAS